MHTKLSDREHLWRRESHLYNSCDDHVVPLESSQWKNISVITSPLQVLHRITAHSHFLIGQSENAKYNITLNRMSTIRRIFREAHPINTFKCNVNAATSNGGANLVIIIRDNHRKHAISPCMYISQCSLEEAEAQALLVGIRLLLQVQASSTTVEDDVQSIILLLQQSTLDAPWRFSTPLKIVMLCFTINRSEVLDLWNERPMHVHII